MRRGKVEMKKIDDKTSRQVSFSKRRNGLFKKAEELSVLCDVDVALLVLSSTGKLFEFPTGNRLSKILERYKAYVDAERTCTRMIRTESCSQNATLWKCKDTLQAVQRYLEGSNVNQMNITDIMQLEHLLDCTLRQTRKRKTYLMTDTISALQKVEKKQSEEKVLKRKEIGAIMAEGQTIDEDEEEDDEEEDEDMEDDKNKEEKKKEQQQASSKGYCRLQAAMLSLA